MKVLPCLLFLFLAVLGGVWGLHEDPHAVQQDLLRRVADITGTPAEMVPFMNDFPVTMSGYGQTMMAGPLRHAYPFLRRDRDALAILVIRGEGSSPMLGLFRNDDITEMYNAVELDGCEISRLKDDRLKIVKGKRSWEFIFPSFHQREKWANAFTSAIAGDVASLAVPAHAKQGLFSDMFVVQEDSLTCGQLDVEHAVMRFSFPYASRHTSELFRDHLKDVEVEGCTVTRELDRLLLITKGDKEKGDWQEWGIVARSFHHREKLVDAFDYALGRGLANRALPAQFKTGPVGMVMTHGPSLPCYAELNAERFALDLFDPQSMHHIAFESVPVLSLTTVEAGEGNDFFIKNPKRSESVTLNAIDRDDWMASLADVIELYDRSFPEVAGGPDGRAREDPCATARSKSRARGLACRTAVTLVKWEVWLAAALAEWKRLAVAALKAALEKRFRPTATSPDEDEGGGDDDDDERPPQGFEATGHLDPPPEKVLGGVRKKLRGMPAAVKAGWAEFTVDLRSPSGQDAQSI